MQNEVKSASPSHMLISAPVSKSTGLNSLSPVSRYRMAHLLICLVSFSHFHSFNKLVSKNNMTKVSLFLVATKLLSSWYWLQCLMSSLWEQWNWSEMVYFNWYRYRSAAVFLDLVWYSATAVVMYLAYNSVSLSTSEVHTGFPFKTWKVCNFRPSEISISTAW